MKIPKRSNKPGFGGISFYHIYRNDQSGELLWPMKAILGGKDARCYENSRAYNPDLKVANNNFEISKGRVLGFGGRRNSPLFLLVSPKFDGQDFSLWVDA